MYVYPNNTELYSQLSIISPGQKVLQLPISLILLAQTNGHIFRPFPSLVTTKPNWVWTKAYSSASMRGAINPWLYVSSLRNDEEI